MTDKGTLRIGTRGSILALKQAEIVQGRLQEAHPGLNVEIKIIKTKGDIIKDVPLSKIGGKGLFTKELEVSLQNKETDIAVHSMKDLPTVFPEGLALGAMMKRDLPNDVVISKYDVPFMEIPAGARIGTSSLRRVAQLKAARPDLNFQDLRGNLETRIKRIEEGVVDAVIVSAAGPIRLPHLKANAIPIGVDICIPAVSQGVIGIEIREGDERSLELIQCLKDEEATLCLTAERGFMATIEGGCQVPVGANATLHGDKIKLIACIASLDGSTVLRDELEGPASEAREIGDKLARELLSRGGDAIITDVRAQGEE